MVESSQGQRSITSHMQSQSQSPSGAKFLKDANAKTATSFHPESPGLARVSLMGKRGTPLNIIYFASTNWRCQYLIIIDLGKCHWSLALVLVDYFGRFTCLMCNLTALYLVLLDQTKSGEILPSAVWPHVGSFSAQYHLTSASTDQSLILSFPFLCHVALSTPVK